MAEKITFTCYYDPDTKEMDFNQYQIPFGLIQPIRWALQKEYDRQGNAITAPHFREERALFLDKVIQSKNEKGLNIDPTKIFIDFTNQIDAPF